MSLDPRALRDAFGRFLTGVTVVTTGGEGRAPSGLTANSFSSVSLEPPLVLFSLATDADCFARFEESEHFAINILEREQREISNRFATKNAEKWSGVPYATGRVGCPILQGALAAFECRVHARYTAGDHVIYVGEVLHLTLGSDEPPLAFYRGDYRALE